MPAFLTIVASPVKVTMLLICILGTAFMLWFLVGLFTDQTRMRARYVVRFKLGEDRPRIGLEDQVSGEPFFDEAKSGNRQTDRPSQFAVQGFRIKQQF